MMDTLPHHNLPHPDPLIPVFDQWIDKELDDPSFPHLDLCGEAHP